jgi:hypothetical protein
MNFYSTIDADGFLSGSMSEVGLNLSNNASNVVFDSPPGLPLGDMQKYRWENGAWAIRTDHRGHSWYDPENPENVHRPASWNDAPPVGWLRWAPGTPQTPSDAAILRKAKADKWQQIKSMAESAAAGGFAAGGFNWDSDLGTQQRMQLTWQDMKESDGPASVTWYTKEGVAKTMTPAQFKSLARALRNHLAQQQDRAATLRTAISTATTAAEVAAISW